MYGDLENPQIADYLPLYRLEDIFARQGFEISWATQSVSNLKVQRRTRIRSIARRG